MAGIDFGNQTSAIALIRKGGIDVVANEASSRLTPSLVGFGTQQRYAGEAAQTQYTTNVRNTVSQIKRFIGRKYSEVQGEINRVPFVVKQLANDEIGFEVSYNGATVTLTPTKVLAILLVQLKKTAEANLNGGRLSDVVLSCPPYFSDSQRRALLNASEIAGLNVVRLMNENTATALSYAFYKLDLPEENPQHVLFVDVGHSATTSSVVALSKGKLRVASTAFDTSCGGRDIDELLVQHFAVEFQKKYNIEVLKNQRALLRLRVACERLKQVLSSGVPEAPLNIECLMEDKDVSSRMTKKDFDEMVAPFLQRIVQVVQKAIADSGVTNEQIQTVEVVGASKRIPLIQSALKELLKRDISQTLNDVESVAKGCALQAAIISPIFKVREFQVVDYQLYPVQISWSAVSQMQDVNSAPKENLFSQGSAVPSTKKLTLKQSEPIEFAASYGDVPSQPALSNAPIGTFKITNIPQTSSNETPKIEVRFRLNPSGVLNLDSAELIETFEEAQQPKPEASATEEPKSPETAAPPKKKVKHVTLQIESQTGSLTKEEINNATEEELNMQAADKLAHETAEARNSLESFILGTRSRLADELYSYTTEAERENFNSLSYKYEDWLYEDEGRDAKKSVLSEKLNELQKLANDPIQRKKQEDLRQTYEQELGRVLQHYRSILNDAKYDHIEQEEKAKIGFECDKVEQEVRKLQVKQENLAKNQNPVFNAEEISNKKKELEKFANTILNKPKPKPAPQPTPQTPPQPQPQEQTQPEVSEQTKTEESKQDVPMQDSFTEVD